MPGPRHQPALGPYGAPFAALVGGIPALGPLLAWQTELQTRANELYGRGGKQLSKHSVVALGELIRRDSVVRMYVERMLGEVPEQTRRIEDVDELLWQLDYILGIAPEWEQDPSKRNFFPMSALFNPMMMTPSGYDAFRIASLNEAIRRVLREWCAFLDSADSRYVLNEGEHGWLSPEARAYNDLEEFVIPDRGAPHWGWGSYNAFFHREIKRACRPIAGPDDPKVIVSANDGTVYRIAREVKASDRFWIKGEPYSLRDMLGGSGYLERFSGGDVFQSYLSGADYHRWHSPIDGVVKEAIVVDGLLFSNLEGTGNDKSGVKNQSYYTAVNSRGLTFVESADPAIGLVCCMAVGITEISSTTLTARRGQQVKKGGQLGYFSYGGSSVAMIFQPGAIERFTVAAPRDADEEKVPIQVNAQIAVAR